MCERVPMPGGSYAIVCSRGSGKKLGKCQECWLVEATLLCDGPRKNQAGRATGGTCDKPLCRGCATSGGPNVDYCRDHKNPASRRLAL